MFIKLLKRATKPDTNSHQPARLAPSAPAIVEKVCRNQDGLAGFFEDLKSQANPNVIAPFAWLVSGSQLLSLWESDTRSSLGSKLASADWDTRVQWAIDLIEAATAFKPHTVHYLQDVTLKVTGQGKCVIDTSACLFRQVLDTKKAQAFYPKDIFWIMTLGSSDENVLDFAHSHWIGSHIIHILTGGAAPYGLDSKAVLEGFKKFIQPKSKAASELQYPGLSSFPDSLALALRKMVSFDSNERYTSTKTAIQDLNEALFQAHLIALLPKSDS